MSDVIKPEPPHPLAMLERAVAQGFSTEQLKVLFNLHSNWNADRAREAFEDAMVTTQAEVLEVTKLAKNKHTGTMYANLESIVPAIKPVYTRNGLRLSFCEEDCPHAGNMRVVCEIGHKLGHTRRYHMDVPLDGQGIKGGTNMTPTQAKGSTFAYGTRYLTVRIFNVPIVGEDNDGNNGEALAVLTVGEVQELDKLIADTKLNPAQFFAWASDHCKFKVECTADLPRRAFLVAHKFLAMKLGSQKAAKKVEPRNEN